METFLKRYKQPIQIQRCSMSLVITHLWPTFRAPFITILIAYGCVGGEKDGIFYRNPCHMWKMNTMGS